MNEDLESQLAIIESTIQKAGFLTINTGKAIIVSLKNRRVYTNEIILVLEDTELDELCNVVNFIGGRISIAPIE